MESLNDHVKLLVQTIATSFNPPSAMMTIRTGTDRNPGSQPDGQLKQHQHFHTLAFLASLHSRAILHV